MTQADYNSVPEDPGIINNIGLKGDYDYAFEKLLTHYLFRHEKETQIAAMQAIVNLVCRYKTVNEDVLPILFKKLNDKDQDIKCRVVDALHVIASEVPKLKEKIYPAFHKFKEQFFTNKEKYDYILYLAHYGDYDYALDYLAKYHLDDTDNVLQITAIQAIEIIVSRFQDIKESLILPKLYKKLDNNNLYTEGIKQNVIDALHIIAHLIPRVKKAIYLTCIQKKIDFFTGNELAIFPYEFFATLTTMEQKVRDIISFCAYSQDYKLALNVCKSYLEDNNDEINTAALQGLAYLVMRYEKIDFYDILPLITRFLKDEKGADPYAESLLATIAIVIPQLKNEVGRILKKIDSRYCALYKLSLSGE